MSLFMNRGFARNYQGAPIIFAHPTSREYINAVMHNCSIDGMHFISDVPLVPGTDIQIEVQETFRRSGIPKAYRKCYAQVVWCKKQVEASAYDIGVRFNRPLTH